MSIKFKYVVFLWLNQGLTYKKTLNLFTNKRKTHQAFGTDKRGHDSTKKEGTFARNY